MTKILIRLSPCLGSSGLPMIHKVSYINAQVLLSLLNELRKKIDARLAEHFIIFAQQV